MRRREFMAASCLAGLAPLSSGEAKDSGDPPKKEYYELRLYHLDGDRQKKLLTDFLRDVAIGAFGRMGIGPVGVFTLAEGDSPDVYVLLPHKSLDSVVSVSGRLAADAEYQRAGASFLDATLSEPGFKRIESSLMVAFDENPHLEVPVTKQSRVFQLRTYESHSAKAARKKVEMFNSGGELDIFRRVGLQPVFFGQTLIGAKLPNLTYMLGFDDMDASQEAWRKFLSDPGWEKLKADPAYKDTVSNITNTFLRPAACSQI